MIVNDEASSYMAVAAAQLEWALKAPANMLQHVAMLWMILSRHLFCRKTFHLALVLIHVHNLLVLVVLKLYA